MRSEMDVDALCAPERAFIDWLADALGRDHQAALELVLAPPDDPSLISTAIDDGRFTRLSLRAIGPRLRWAQPEGPLALPLDGLAPVELDVHDLGLSHLDVPATATRLDCSANELRQLELGHVNGLQVLEASANDLMVLDLRDLHQMTFISCSGNALSALVISPQAPLRALRAERNQLMVVDLGERRELTDLRLGHNEIVALHLTAPRLRSLSVHNNQLEQIDLSGFSSLEQLDVGTNRLARLDLSGSPWLQELRCSRNYLDSVDTTLPYLEVIDVSCNQLESLVVERNAALYELNAEDNRITALRLADCPALESLKVRQNALRALDLAGAPKLVVLDAADNQLSRVSIGPAVCLVELELRGNPLEHLDLSGATDLVYLELAGAPEVVASEALVRRLPALRRLRGLPQHERLEAMDRYELHHFAAVYDEPDRESRLLEVVQDTERCALGTAMLVYWRAHPHYYLQFDERDAVPAYARAGWDLVRTIETNVRDNAYAHDDLPFDPRNDRTATPAGKDWTASSHADARNIPGFMTRAVGAG